MSSCNAQFYLSGRTLLLLLQAEKNNSQSEINVWPRFFITLPVQKLSKFGECLPPTNSVLQLIHRVEFFQCLFQNHTFTFNHDLPKWSQYKNWFSDTLLFIKPKISISSHESNYLVNSRPETLLILVKHAINEQRISKGY